MIDIHQAFKKARKLDFSAWRRLVLLSLGAALLGAGWVCLDIASISFLLENKLQYTIGFNFLIIAILLSFIGSISTKLDRRHGYGGVPLCAFLLLLLLGNIFWLTQGSFTAINVLFILKYTLPVLMSVAFWTISSRFIVLGFNSLKYLGVLAAQLFGFYGAGLFLNNTEWDSLFILKMALFSWIGLVLVLKILVWILPQPSETFVRKTGGVQDSFEQKMIDCILMLAFFYTSGRVLGDYLLYQELLKRPHEIISILAKLWMFCGGIGVISLIFLSRTRFLYTTLWGLLGICLGLSGIASGSYLNIFNLFCFGFILFWICSFLYWLPYMRLLPRPLTLGHGMRLRKKRQMIIEPLGFVLVGAVVLTMKQNYLPVLLGFIAFVLTVLIFVSVFLYSRLLYRLFKMRSWCGSPLMLLSKKLERYVLNGAQNEDVQEAIYFLKIMEIAHTGQYQKQLLKALHHPCAEVRKFALDKLEIFITSKKVLRAISNTFQKDKDVSVRSRALAILIHFEGEDKTHNIYAKYGAYLDDEKLKYGAILGFLQSGGEWALLAMDGLQKLVSSRQKDDNLMALKIIKRVSNQGLVRLIIPLLKSPYTEVVQSGLLVAGYIGHAQTLNDIFRSLDDIELQEYALKALNLYGKKAFPPLEKMLQNTIVPMERRKKLVLFLGLLPSGEGKQILLRNLYLSDLKLRKEIFLAVLNSSIVWVSRQRKKILRNGIHQDVLWWHLLEKNILLLQQAPQSSLGDSFSFLRRSFEEIRDDLRTLVLLQILLLNPSSLVRKAVDILTEKPSQRFVTAAGILQDLLSKKLYQDIKPLLLAPLEKQTELKPILMDISESKRFLEQLIVSPAFPENHWVIAAALYGLQKVGDDHSKIVLPKAFCYPHPVVLEAALGLLEYLEPNVQKRKKFLFDQIHQTPHNFILENYLKKERYNDYL